MPSAHPEVEPRMPLQPVPLTLVWFCTGSNDPAAQSATNLDALSFLRALQGERIGREATIPLFDGYRRLNNDNLDQAIDWFGEMVKTYLRRQSIGPPFFVIPMPDLDTTLESSAGPWISLLAMAVASEFEEGVEMLDVLRWKESPLSLGPEASDSVRLEQNLALLGRVEWDRPVVLVDYLVNAARARACEAFLRAQGARVLLGVMAGRKVTENPHQHFSVFRAELSRISHTPSR